MFYPHKSSGTFRLMLNVKAFKENNVVYRNIFKKI